MQFVDYEIWYFCVSNVSKKRFSKEQQQDKFSDWSATEEASKSNNFVITSSPNTQSGNNNNNVSSLRLLFWVVETNYVIKVRQI